MYALRTYFFFCLLSSRVELTTNLLNYHNSMSLCAKKITQWKTGFTIYDGNLNETSATSLETKELFIKTKRMNNFKSQWLINNVLVL